jgi:hypothetical protein
MPQYDTSQTSPGFEPPARRGFGSGIWPGVVVVIALIILGVFVWGGTGSQTPSTAQQQPAATTGSTAPGK